MSGIFWMGHVAPLNRSTHRPVLAPSHPTTLTHPKSSRVSAVAVAFLDPALTVDMCVCVCMSQWTHQTTQHLPVTHTHTHTYSPLTTSSHATMSRRTAIIDKPCPDAHRSAAGCPNVKCPLRHDLENIKKVTNACMTKGCVYRTNNHKAVWLTSSVGHCPVSVHYCRDCFKSQRTRFK